MKPVFVFAIETAVDLITNSSSELFVFKNRKSKEVKKLLDMEFPGWQHEYYDPKDISDCSDGDVEVLISYANYYRKGNYGVPNDLSKEIAEFRQQNPDLVLLFSKDDNPNWDRQEELMCHASRYHLG